jgi:hypothetical protein
MQEVRFDRLSLEAAGPILQSVIGEKQMTKLNTKYPTPEELYAVEMEARRLRAQTVAAGFRKAVASVKGLFERPVARNVRHA